MVVVGDVVAHQRAAVGEPHAFHRPVVLDRRRNARERALIARADLICRSQRALRVDLHERVELRIELLDLLERALHQLARRDFSRAHHPGKLGRGLEQQVVLGHGSSSKRLLGHVPARLQPTRAGIPATIWACPEGSQPPQASSSESECHERGPVGDGQAHLLRGARPRCRRSRRGAVGP